MLILTGFPLSHLGHLSCADNQQPPHVAFVRTGGAQDIVYFSFDSTQVDEA